MSAQDFLLEIGTEELPPKSLKAMGRALENSLTESVRDAGLAYTGSRWFAAPRRLAVLIRGLAAEQPEQHIEKRGPSVKAAYDTEGKPTRAAEGFARSCGVSAADLQVESTDKGDYLVFRDRQPGQTTQQLLPGMMEKAVAGLPVAKRMRWGAHDFQFVRPVKWIVALFGPEILPYRLFGLDAGNHSYGHRIHHPEAVRLQQPGDYETALENAYVLPDFDRRVELIRERLKSLGNTADLRVQMDNDLLEEVAALNEWPVVLSGRFDSSFLEVPEEALVSSMQDHQKYFPARDRNGRLVSTFFFVANLESLNPESVIQGNERVIRPRLADAAFFWNTDRQQPLESRLGKLDKVVFQKALGSVGNKARRLGALAAGWAPSVGLESAPAQRAGELAKCDLVTDMVFEFDDLQGIAGYYYAREDGESDDVALAIRDQYRPGYAGDDLPETRLGALVGVADRIDTLTGIFGIGQKPTGTRDPFALRRASLAVLRLLIEGGLDLDVRELVADAIARYREQDVRFSTSDPELKDSIHEYLLDRLRGYYVDQGISVGVFLSVAAMRPARPVDFEARIRAVSAFVSRAEAQALGQMNKRVDNILAKTGEEIPEIDRTGLEKARSELGSRDSAEQDAESRLLDAMTALSPVVDARADQLDYAGLLDALSDLTEPLDRFFDHVMVMSENRSERQRRLALLACIRGWFLRVADISHLDTEN